MLDNFFTENEISYLENESLKKHNTFKVGGEARYIAFPNDEKQVITLLKHLEKEKIKYYFLGRGSNVIFRDEGFDGVIIKSSNLKVINFIDSNTVYVQSGVSLNNICKVMQDNSLAGIEFCYGIPGNIGGAVYMNAGAYGGEICQAVESVKYIDENFEVKTITNKDCEFSYRNSIFQNKKWFILGCTLKLHTENKDIIQQFMDDIMQKRLDKQPLDMPSAGSSFKRPVGYFAAALIEESGLKGYSIGGAQISKKHAGFIVNTGNATCKDIEDLANFTEKTVFEKTGIAIKKEMIIV